jgi:hypothetical protein
MLDIAKSNSWNDLAIYCPLDFRALLFSKKKKNLKSKID